jgi:hypothetical protein
VCGLDRTYQQPLQLDERSQIDARRANGHPGANHGIEHPTSYRDHDAARPLHFQKLACRSMLHSAYGDLTAKIWVPLVVDFQLLPDMGRMNG